MFQSPLFWILTPLNLWPPMVSTPPHLWHGIDTINFHHTTAHHHFFFTVTPDTTRRVTPSHTFSSHHRTPIAHQSHTIFTPITVPFLFCLSLLHQSVTPFQFLHLRQTPHTLTISTHFKNLHHDLFLRFTISHLTSSPRLRFSHLWNMVSQAHHTHTFLFFSCHLHSSSPHHISHYFYFSHSSPYPPLDVGIISCFFRFIVLNLFFIQIFLWPFSSHHKNTDWAILDFQLIQYSFFKYFYPTMF